MIKGTTPTFIFETDDKLDLNDIDNIHVIIQSVSTQIIKDLSSIDIEPEKHIFKLFLSQEETFHLGAGDCKVQVRVLLKNGTAMSTHPMTRRIDASLENEVIEPYEKR